MTKIEWATRVWNPITGCTPISEGCAHCYAKRMASRLRGRYGYDPVQPFVPTVHIDRFNEPYEWKQPSRVFVVSMGDLFHQQIQEIYLDMIFAVMHDQPQHTWIILTKRPHRMAAYFDLHEIPPNTWLGTTIENQQAANDRLPHLLRIGDQSFARRWVSVEPMLGMIDITHALGLSPDCQRLQNSRLSWVVCGAESGPGKRSCDQRWVRHLKDQCSTAQVPFFYKQSIVDGHKKTMPELDGRVWDEYPEGMEIK
jgi:protein gp37